MLLKELNNLECFGTALILIHIHVMGFIHNDHIPRLCAKKFFPSSASVLSQCMD